MSSFAVCLFPCIWWHLLLPIAASFSCVGVSPLWHSGPLCTNSKKSSKQSECIRRPADLQFCSVGLGRLLVPGRNRRDVPSSGACWLMGSGWSLCLQSWEQGSQPGEGGGALCCLRSQTHWVGGEVHHPSHSTLICLKGNGQALGQKAVDRGS